MKYRGVIALADLEHQRLARALGGKVLIEAFAQHRRVDANDVVAGGVVVRGPTKNPVPYFLLVDLVHVVVEHALGEVHE